jgi:ubiquitin carboxyl-terminal hydrolase 5/13
VVKTIGLETCLDRWAAETTVDDISWPHLMGAKHAALRTTKLANFPRYLFVQLQRYTLGPDWQPVKLQVNLQLPPPSKEGKYIIDLAKYKTKGGPQPNEILVPDNNEQETTNSATGSASAAEASITASIIDEAALSQLMDMGFTLNSCKRALNAVGGANVEAAMTWVFEHNTDADFNDPLPDDNDDTQQAGGASNSNNNNGGGVDEGAVQSLVEMLGCFTADQVRFALKETNGASDRAADWLFSHMDDVDTLMVAAAAANEAMTTVAADTNDNASSLLPPLEDSSSSGDGDDATSTYQLTGLVSHIGKNTGSGHHVAHLFLNEQGNKWYIFNDEKVAVSSKPPVEHAYLYLFQRTDTLNGPGHAHY